MQPSDAGAHGDLMTAAVRAASPLQRNISAAVLPVLAKGRFIKGGKTVRERMGGRVVGVRMTANSENNAECRAEKESKSDEPLEAIVDEAIANADGGEVSLKNMLTAWGDRSYGPLFIVLGAFAGTPLAAVPFAAAAIGVIIAALAAQMLFGKAHPWLPDFTLDWSVKEDKVETMRERFAPMLQFVDHLITERLEGAVSAPVRRAAAAIVMALGVLMVPFDAVPMAVAAPAWTVVLFGVAITARDGLVMVIALAACAAIGFLGVKVL